MLKVTRGLIELTANAKRVSKSLKENAEKVRRAEALKALLGQVLITPLPFSS